MEFEIEKGCFSFRLPQHIPVGSAARRFPKALLTALIQRGTPGKGIVCPKHNAAERLNNMEEFTPVWYNFMVG